MSIFNAIHPIQTRATAMIGVGAVGSAARRYALVAGMAAVLGAGGAVAAKAPGAGIPYRYLFTATSEQGEPLNAFLLRVAQRQRQFSDETGLEACGLIAKDPETDRYGIVVGTSEAHVGCVLYRALPAGMASTGESIHSHGNRKPYHMNAADIAFSRLAGIHARPGRGFSPNLYRFSKTDLAGSAGYLATPKGIVYHNGDGGAMSVASYESISIASTMP